MAKKRRPEGYPTPYQRIVEAGERGTGCRLSFDEVHRLCGDHAIYERAALDDEDEEDLVAERATDG
jgi:hypothetical protein